MFIFTDTKEMVIKDKIFVFTGFDVGTETRLTKQIITNDGLVKSSVVLATDYLIVNENYDHETVKYRRAVELNNSGKNIQIISLSMFDTLVKNIAYVSTEDKISVDIKPDSTDIKKVKVKKEIRRLSEIPTGSGNIEFDKVSFALLGITGADKSQLTEFIENKGGIVGSPSKKTQYLIYDSEKGPSLKFWNTAMERQNEGSIYMMPDYLFNFWTDVKYFPDSTKMIDLIEHYLSFPDDWITDKLNRNTLVEMKIGEYHKQTLDRIYTASRFNCIDSLFTFFSKLEYNYKENGYSDGFYTYNLLNTLIERAIADRKLEMISYLLDYKEKHYSEEFTEEAESIAIDYEFGLKEKPLIYNKPGDIITFGHYPQFNENSNDPIEWEILKSIPVNRKALVISKYALDCKPYNDKYKKITWEYCTLRKWLNTEFINKAFSEDEINRIILVTVINKDNERYVIAGGNNTEDRIFLLSSDEAKELFFDNDARRRITTAYAVKNGAYKSSNNHCWWWLRSPGDNSNNAAGVLTDGSVSDNGDHVDNYGLAVCPAFWINL